jgi:hypothetical protein
MTRLIIVPCSMLIGKSTDHIVYILLDATVFLLSATVSLAFLKKL